MSCDPNVLIQAARCFSCIPGLAQQWVKDYLLCQWTAAITTYPPAVGQRRITLLDTTIGTLNLDLTNINPSIQSLAFPNLKTVTGNLTINGHISQITFDPDNPSQVFFPELQSVSGILVIQNTVGPLNFPKLQSIGPNGAFDVDGAQQITQTSFPVLTLINQSDFHFHNTGLRVLDLSRLASGSKIVSFDALGGVAPAVFNSVNIGLACPVSGSDWELGGNALDVASVNHLLARCVVAGPGVIGGVLKLDGGTSAAPTGQGILDAATLIGRGWVVSTN